MKKDFISFKRGESKKKYSEFSKKERQIIEDFVKYVSITSSSKKRLENNRRTLTHFRCMLEKDFDKTNLQDLRDYLSLLKSSKNTNSSQNEFKATIKRFLKWKFEDWSKRFHNLEDVKLHMKINESKINADTLLKKKDIERIVKEEKTTFWKAFFLTLYESGLRPGELRTLTWDRIKFDVEGDISEINVYATKTHKSRSVYIQKATFYLRKLKEQRKDLKNPLVFPSVKNPSIPITKDYVSHWLTRISKKVLGRSVSPYMLRHTRATELYTNANIPDKLVQKFLGHSKSMSDVYTHLSNKDVKEAMGKTIYKFEDLPPEKKHQLEREVEELKKKNKIMAEETHKILSNYKKEIDLENEKFKEEMLKLVKNS